jgi:pyruvate dehydrogenase E1 component beta subunit
MKGGKDMKSFLYAQLEGIQTEMRKDPEIFFMYEYQVPVAASAGKPIINLKKEFGEVRVSNSGLDEMWYIAAPMGAGMTGQKAIGHIPSMTPLVPFELIVWHAGKLRHMTGGLATFPVVLIVQETAMSPGFAGQHSCYGEERYYAGTPGLKVVVPSTPYDAKGLMVAAIRDPDPVVYIDTRGIASVGKEAPDDDYEVAIGKAEKISEGSDITIVGFGLIMVEMRKAVKKLQGEGVKVDCIDLRTIMPLDDETVIASVKKTGKLLCAESGWYTLGVMSEVIARTAENVKGATFKRIAFPDAPPPASPEMMRWMKVDAGNIYDAAKKIL